MLELFMSILEVSWYLFKYENVLILKEDTRIYPYREIVFLFSNLCYSTQINQSIISNLLSLQVFFFGYSCCRFDHHHHGDKRGGGEQVVDEAGADQAVHLADGGEHEEGGEAPEQLTGPGQAALVIQQTNVGQTPEAVGSGHKQDSL